MACSTINKPFWGTSICGNLPWYSNVAMNSSLIVDDSPIDRRDCPCSMLYVWNDSSTFTSKSDLGQHPSFPWNICVTVSTMGENRIKVFGCRSRLKKVCQDVVAQYQDKFMIEVTDCKPFDPWQKAWRQVGCPANCWCAGYTPKTNTVLQLGAKDRPVDLGVPIFRQTQPHGLHWYVSE